MRTIYKYPLQLERKETVITATHGCKLLHVGQDPSGDNCVWVELDPSEQEFKFTLRIIGTGHKAPDDMVHCGSFNDGPFMWHVYSSTSFIL